MKKLLLLSSIIFLCNYTTSAQNEEKPQLSKFNIHADVATFGILSSFSINAEGYLLGSRSRIVNLYGSVGYAYFVVDFFGVDRYNGFTTSLTLLVGKNKHYFETNLGTYIQYYKRHEVGYASIYPLFNVGYRHQKPESDLFFRIKIGTMGAGVGVGVAF